jgi:acetoin utilization protein AcuC
MREIGADRFLEPEIATDEELERLHSREYIAAVRRFGANPDRAAIEAGIGPGDCPPFAGMHEASARVAGGSIQAVERILDGDATHAFHPGGGLHHAMRGNASGFCIYNDVALGVARARDAGHRVLYVDLDVHHGDGTQTLFWDDAEVVTLSIHETGQALFPGTGFVEESGGPSAPGTAVNVPLEPFSGDESWLEAVESIVPALAERVRPTFLVSQHGCDSHAYDPLAHLRLTTGAYGRVTALLDKIAHEYCQGRWLATGGGGYDVYRVVPRSWSIVWLGQSHEEVPTETPSGWRERWAQEADRYGQAPTPERFLDPDGLVTPDPADLRERNRRTWQRSLQQTLDLLPA